MDARNEAAAYEQFRNLAKQNFEKAIDVMLNDEVDLATIVKNFRKAASDITANIPKTYWTNADYTLLMQANAFIINNILHYPLQHEISVKDATRYAVDMYKSTDHAKASLDYYLAAFEASINYAGQYADTRSLDNQSEISFAQYAAYTRQAEIIAKKTWEAVMAAFPRVTHEQTRKLAFCDAKLTNAHLACGQFDMALISATKAIHSLSTVGDASVFDLFAIADVYKNLAVGFAFEPAYAELFQFASDLFRGKPRANFMKLEEVMFALKRVPDENYQVNDMLLQLMRLWEAKHDLLYDDSVFTQEMSGSYCRRRFDAIKEEQEEREREHLHAMFALEPLFDYAAGPAAPEFLQKHSLFRAETTSGEAPAQGREIRIHFGKN